MAKLNRPLKLTTPARLSEAAGESPVATEFFVESAVGEVEISRRGGVGEFAEIDFAAHGVEVDAEEIGVAGERFGDGDHACELGRADGAAAGGGGGADAGVDGRPVGKEEIARVTGEAVLIDLDETHALVDHVELEVGRNAVGLAEVFFEEDVAGQAKILPFPVVKTVVGAQPFGGATADLGGRRRLRHAKENHRGAVGGFHHPRFCRDFGGGAFGGGVNAEEPGQADVAARGAHVVADGEFVGIDFQEGATVVPELVADLFAERARDVLGVRRGGEAIGTGGAPIEGDEAARDAAFQRSLESTGPPICEHQRNLAGFGDGGHRADRGVNAPRFPDENERPWRVGAEMWNRETV